ncbi:hypothetical protein [Leadbetterella byssophila]|uniref:hypothetical protein n=1 Tax=Leadbetterella byssophila TaxID=316068 RepID=UPI0039A2DC6D
MSEQDVLKDIRSIMERSTRFHALSGESGIWVGVLALLFSVYRVYRWGLKVDTADGAAEAVLLLILSVTAGYLWAKKRAMAVKQSLWSASSKAMIKALAVPLLVGGFLVISFMSLDLYGLVVPMFLIFYGLGLYAASTYTFKELQLVGILFLLLGMVSFWVPEYGVVFFGLGFGLLHIGYGFIIKSTYGG